MRTALRPTRADTPSALPFSFVAPTGGWNARDAIANMPITDAEVMDNWFPEATDVRTRPGTLTYCSGLNGQVETVFAYAKQNTIQILCAVGGTIQNISTVQASGTVFSTSTVANGFANDRWQYVNIGTPGGSFMISVNGSNSNQIYNGSVMFSQTVLFGASSSIQASNVTLYNRRIFYTEPNTLRFIYHEQVNAIGGTVQPFDLSGLLPKGGYLMGLDTWTRDAGAGPDDYIAFISSRGEVAVYQGIDPGSATTWSMVGVYQLPAPLSPRSTQKLGGDLLIATEGGVFPLSEAVSGPLQQQASVSDKIRNKVNDVVRTYRANFGWEVRYYSAGHWLIFNVPVTSGSQTDQYVMNTNTGAWCRFLGVVANCFCVYNNRLYFGSNGKVIRHDVPATTSLGDNGTNISVDVKQAASTFGMPGRLKQAKLFKPQIATNGDLPIAMGVDWDFSPLVPTNMPTPVTVPYADWDLNDWDTCYWAGEPFPIPQWQGISGLGTYGNIRMVGAIKTEELRWYGTDIVLEAGEMV